ncbi:hypothetical protein ACFR97_09700 [Haloplanus litoreus]|uniref:Halobacterial output domain-containing protein n=1 Tax=Haloplanus litoreus TaxID=767515 RepID=A0ABD5ZTU7_9EURY
MSTQSQDLADGRELAAYDRDDDETLEMAIAQAFGRVGIDVMERETPFHEMVNVDALRDLHEESRATPIRTTLTLYDHPVTITSEEVRIYAASAGDE